MTIKTAFYHQKLSLYSLFCYYQNFGETFLNFQLPTLLAFLKIFIVQHYFLMACFCYESISYHNKATSMDAALQNSHFTNRQFASNKTSFVNYFQIFFSSSFDSEQVTQQFNENVFHCIRHHLKDLKISKNFSSFTPLFL